MSSILADRYIAPPYMSPNAEDKGRGCGVSANKYSCAHGQINFGYLITINVSVVFMARYIMVLRGATSL